MAPKRRARAVPRLRQRRGAAARHHCQSGTPALAPASASGRPHLGQYPDRASRTVSRQPPGLHDPRRRRRDRQADAGVEDGDHQRALQSVVVCAAVDRDKGNPAEAGARSELFGAAPHGHAAEWRDPAIAGSRHGARPTEIRSVEPFRRLSARHAAEVAVQTRRPVREPRLRARREPARTRRPAARRARRGDRQRRSRRARPLAACCRSRSRPFWFTRPLLSILDGSDRFCTRYLRAATKRSGAICSGPGKYPWPNATPPPNAEGEEAARPRSTRGRNIA